MFWQRQTFKVYSVETYIGVWPALPFFKDERKRLAEVFFIFLINVDEISGKFG
jgi:hypothetical protein